MTKYQVINPLWDGSRWHQPGQPYPPEGHDVPAAQLQRYHDGEFIATPDEIARAANPEAHGARTELQQAQGRVQELEGQLSTLTAQFPDVVTLDDLGTRIVDLEEQLKVAQERQPDAELQSRITDLNRQLSEAQQSLQTTQQSLQTTEAKVSEAAESNKTLQDQLTAAQEGHHDLQGQLLEAQAVAAQPADVEALARYRSVVGDLLPQGELSDATYQALLTSGYYTPKQIQSASDAELKKVQHLDAVGIGKLRAAYPKG